MRALRAPPGSADDADAADPAGAGADGAGNTCDRANILLDFQFDRTNITNN